MPRAVPPEVYALLADYVEQRTGIHYAREQADIFLSKVETRADEVGFESLLDYYFYLRYDPAGAAELDELIDALVVPETYFFRDLETLRALVTEVLVPRARRHRSVRVWSAACASGEEPLTLAMLLAHEGVLDDTEIVATDLSRRALARARSGRYGRRSLRDALPEDLLRWISFEGEAVVVSPGLRQRIDWRRVNLVRPEEVRALGTFDAILCRNVLIYFRDETARLVVESLAGCLREQGVLVVGAAESLLRYGTSLRWEERRGVFFYRKQSA